MASEKKNEIAKLTEVTQGVSSSPTSAKDVKAFQERNRFINMGKINPETPDASNMVSQVTILSEESEAMNPRRQAAAEELIAALDQIKKSLEDTRRSREMFKRTATAVTPSAVVFDKINRHQAQTAYYASSETADQEYYEEEYVDESEETYEETEELEEESEEVEIEDNDGSNESSNNNNNNNSNDRKSNKQKKQKKKKDPKKTAPKKSKASNAAAKKASKKAASKAATKAASSKAASKGIGLILKKYWWVIAIIVVVILLILLLVLLLSASGGSHEYAENSYLDPEYDYTQTVVILTNSYTNESEKVQVEQLMIEDLVKGAVYAEYLNEGESLSNEQLIEVYKTYLIVAKTLALSIGNYSNDTKEITLQSGTSGLPYCDVDNGCKVIAYNGKYTYVSSNFGGDIPGNVIKTIPPMDNGVKQLLNDAYSKTKFEILVPKSVNEPITSYTYGIIDYTQNIKSNWIALAGKNKTYENIINATNEYKDLKIYDIREYATVYTPSSSDSYWWPIGGPQLVNGLYSGKPTVTYVSSGYGWRTISGKKSFHQGVDIASAGCSDHVIIAAKSGTVTTAKGGCPSFGSYGNNCNGGYGNYVMIEHDDGSTTVYAHMYKDSITVKKGDRILQGQKLGLMGSSGSSTGCHLHFEIRMNGSKVNPLDYINAENPRPTGITGGYAEGNNNMQTVCLSLKKSGFSDNAVAGILTNIQAESSFRPTALGDNGTSYGLCQWHNGRYTRLKEYCQDQYSTINCQLSYLLNELQKSYIGVYNYLLTDNTAWNIANYYCLNFEIPANRQVTCSKRASNYSDRFLTYVRNGCN